MFRMTRIVPTTVLTLAALALAAPGAQAKLMSGQFGGSASVNSSVLAAGGPNDVSPIVQSVQAAKAEKQAGVVVTTGDTPLANPVQLPENLSVGLMHASTVHGPVEQGPKTPVSVPDSSGNGFDWTAAAIGAALGGILMLMLAGGFGIRRRGQLAA